MSECMNVFNLACCSKVSSFPRDTLKSFTLSITVKTIAKPNPDRSDKVVIKIEKISRRGSRSPDNAEFGRFTLLFC